MLSTGVTEHLNSMISIDTLHFMDGSSQSITFSKVFRKDRPLILAVVDNEAQTQVLGGLKIILAGLPFIAAQDYDVVIVSSAGLGGLSKLSETTWQYLNGADPTLEQLKIELGVNGAHPPGIYVLTAHGKIARYLYGTTFHEKDLKFALMEASNSYLGNAFDRILLFVFHFDENRNSYTVDLWKIVTIVLIAQAFIFGLFYFLFWGRKRPAQ